MLEKDFETLLITAQMRFNQRSLKTELRVSRIQSPVFTSLFIQLPVYLELKSMSISCQSVLALTSDKPRRQELVLERFDSRLTWFLSSIQILPNIIANYYNINFKMRPKQPIPLSSIFEYYAYGNALKRPKEELINQFMDLSCICEFLLDRIPSVMKNLRQSVKLHQKGIKDLSTNIRQSVNMAVEDPKMDECFYLQSAYDQFSNFSLNKLVENDYVEKSLAEKQMKLKFMESENLPDDFIWEKPIKPGRDSFRKSSKDYSWHSYFNSKYRMLEITTRKYKILISLAVANNSYIWAIDRIVLKASQETVFYMVKYFEQKIKPIIKSLYPLAYEQNMLACINRYSYYLELMDLNLNMCALTSSLFFSERITTKHQGKDYQFIFTKPEELDDAILTITQADRPNIVTKLWFMRKQIICILEIEDAIILRTAQQFKYENYKSLLCIMEQLVDYSTRVLQFFKRFQQADFQRNLFIKLAGMYWICGNDWLGKANCYLVNENGAYIGKVVQNSLLYASIHQDGSLSSPRISRAFLTKLIKEVSVVDIFFYFVYIIQKLLLENAQRQTELDHYYINEKDREKRVILYFKKKSCVEEHMMKVYAKTQITEEQSFNVVKFTAEFSLNFQHLAFYNFRDPQQKILYEKQEWRQFFSLQQSELLDIPKVIETIQYLQENMIFQFVIQRKMKSDSKPLYSIKI